MSVAQKSEYPFTLEDDDGDHLVYYFPPVKKELNPEKDRCAFHSPAHHAHASPLRRASVGGRAVARRPGVLFFFCLVAAARSSPLRRLARRRRRRHASPLRALTHAPPNRAMALIRKMGGIVAKKYGEGVIELAPPGTTAVRPGVTFYSWTWVFDCHGEQALKDIADYLMTGDKGKKKAKAKDKTAAGGGKAGKRMPYTQADDKEIIRWCLRHGDGRPSFERAIEEGVCQPDHPSMESMRTRCRNFAIKNIALVAQVQRENDRARKAPASSPAAASQQPFTQAPSDSEDNEYDDFASDEAAQEKERAAREASAAKKKKKKKKKQQKQAASAKKKKSSPSPARAPTKAAQAALKAAQDDSQNWAEPEGQSAAAAAAAPRSGGRRSTRASPATAAAADDDDDLVDQLLSDTTDTEKVAQQEQYDEEEEEDEEDDDLISSLLNGSTGSAAAAPSVHKQSPSQHDSKGYR